MKERVFSFFQQKLNFLIIIFILLAAFIVFVNHFSFKAWAEVSLICQRNTQRGQPDECVEFTILVTQDGRSVKAEIIATEDRDGDGDSDDEGDETTFTWYRYIGVSDGHVGCLSQHNNNVPIDIKAQKAQNEQYEEFRLNGRGGFIEDIFEGLTEEQINRYTEYKIDGELAVCFTALAKNYNDHGLKNEGGLVLQPPETVQVKEAGFDLSRILAIVGTTAVIGIVLFLVIKKSKKRKSY